MNRAEKTAALCDQDSMRTILLAAVEAALKAGEVIRSNFNKPHHIRHKGRIDIVTETDLAAEKVIMAALERHALDAVILAEESHSNYSAHPKGPAWIIDPLDGTTNFAHGFPHFGVSIAYAIDGLAEVGVIYCPIQDELFCACRDCGAWLNGTKIKVSAVSSLDNALVATGFPYNIQENLELVISQVRGVLPFVQDIRRAGAAALDLAYVACGRLDAFWEMDLKPWDTSAGQIILSEAGGTMTDFSGSPFSPFFPEVIASNTALHEDIFQLLQPHIGKRGPNKKPDAAIK